MQALDDASPDRLGWPCFGAAGDSVDVSGVPVTWAPGQGIVEYPSGMGVPIKTTDKLVIQIHYNLADPASAGKTDSTAVHLRFASSVSREIRFSLPDGLLDTLGKATPDTLAPGQSDVSYSWMQGGRDLGLRRQPVRRSGRRHAAHARARHSPEDDDRRARQPRAARRTSRTGTSTGRSSTSTRRPSRSRRTSQVQVTCEYNTSADTAPVLPGWGTRNEMCLTVLMIALPPS